MSGILLAAQVLALLRWRSASTAGCRCQPLLSLSTDAEHWRRRRRRCCWVLRHVGSKWYTTEGAVAAAAAAAVLVVVVVVAVTVSVRLSRSSSLLCAAFITTCHTSPPTRPPASACPFFSTLKRLMFQCTVAASACWSGENTHTHARTHSLRLCTNSKLGILVGE